MIMSTKRSNDGRHLDAQSKEAIRLRAVDQIAQGESPEAMAEALGVNRRTVYRWLERAHHGGREALYNRAKSGRPTKFTAADLQWLSGALRDSDPRQYRFAFALWTRDIVRELLRRERGVRVSAVTVGRVLRRLGFTPQRPLRRAWQQSPEAVAEWKQTVYPEIRRRAQRERARIYFADESGVRSDYHAGTTWAPTGETPIVEATGARFSINLVSAISPGGSLRFQLVEGTVTAEVFAGFIQRLAADTAADEKVFLIVDGHPTHRAKRVRRTLEALDGRVELFFLPGYSPELNPDEQVWGYVKSRLGRGAIASKDELKMQARSLLHSLQKLPDKVAAFFRHPECQYAR
ncbi:Transposase [Salinisphaera sp. LB1]|nr:hypothetical protein SALB1_1283 [Salinisphaera sp. LB1]AWN15877.1 hypothetical protein SALB1_1679 [Salinisphaera sp. LB1]AWN17021.1 hypothetical protein SALB1_2825 [Salinisphaera sp. LB1]AWN17172.1 Transposase [Salinisphaera sp. LB1]